MYFLILTLAVYALSFMSQNFVNICSLHDPERFHDVTDEIYHIMHLWSLLRLGKCIFKLVTL